MQRSIESTQNSCWQERSDEDGQTASSWQALVTQISTLYNQAEQNSISRRATNIEVNALQQQNTKSGPTHVSQKQESEITVGTD